MSWCKINIVNIGKWLHKLGKIWGAIIIIPTLLGLGFAAGCNYEEWKLTKIHTADMIKEYDKRTKENLEVARREFDYQQQILNMQAELKAQEYKIRIYEAKFKK